MKITLSISLILLFAAGVQAQEPSSATYDPQTGEIIVPYWDGQDSYPLNPKNPRSIRRYPHSYYPLMSVYGEDSLITLEDGTQYVVYAPPLTIDIHGKQLPYSHYGEFSNGLIAVRHGDFWGYINDEGKEVIPLTLKYDEAGDFNQGIAAIRAGKLWGFIDATGKEIVAPQYQQVGMLPNSKLTAVKMNEKWGFVDTEGKVVTPFKYDLYDGLGFYGERTSTLIPVGLAYETKGLIPDDYTGPSHQLYKWGFIDSTGKEVIPPKYDNVKWYDEGYMVNAGAKPVLVNDRYYDEYGEPEESYEFLGGTWGYINAAGVEIVPSINDYDPLNLHDYEEENYLVFGHEWFGIKKGNQTGFINALNRKEVWWETVRTVDSASVSRYMAFAISNNRALVQETYVESKGISNKWIIIDEFGKEMDTLSERFERIDLFGGNLESKAFVFFRREADGKTGVLNLITRKEIVPERTDLNVRFFNSIGFFCVGKRISDTVYWLGIMDSTGNEILPAQYDLIEPFTKDLLIVGSGGEKNGIGEFVGGKFGFVDRQGKFTGLKYDYTYNYFPFGIAPVYVGGPKDEDGNFSNVLWGYIDRKGEEVIPLKYASVNSMGNSQYVLVQLAKNKKWGVLDLATQEEIIPAKFDDIEHFGEKLLKVSKKGKFGLVDNAGKIILEVKCDSIESTSLNYRDTPLFPFKFKGKWGMLDDKGNIAIPAKYEAFVQEDAYSELSQAGLIKTKLAGKWGLIDLEGKVVFPFRFDDFTYWGLVKSKVSPVKIGEKWGLVDSIGKELFPPTYDFFFADLFWGEFFKASKGGKVVIVDITGKEIVDPKYVFIEGQFGENNYLLVNDGGSVKKVTYLQSQDVSGGKWGFIDRNGKEAIPPKYDEIKEHDKLMLVAMNGKYGILDRTNLKELAAPNYDTISKMTGYIYNFETENTYFNLKKNGKWGLADSTGREVVLPEYDQVYCGSLLIYVRKGGKYGLIDMAGKELIAPKYDRIEDFFGGYARVVLNGKTGLIDSSGKEVVAPKYDKISQQFDDYFESIFKDGFAKVESHSNDGILIGLIDMKGKEIVPPVYIEINEFSEDLVAVKKFRRWGFLNQSGKVIIPFIYNSVSDFTDGKAEVLVGDDRYYIDKTGKRMK